ncbi:MAG: hypothetical protein WBD36_11730 [Bacteroidota bacterium]
MKTLLLVVILTLLTVSVVNAQECSSNPYEQNLHGSSYTWWVQSTGLNSSYSDGSPVTVADIREDVEFSAASWMSAVNGLGTVVTFTEAESAEEANITIVFENGVTYCGDTEGDDGYFVIHITNRSNWPALALRINILHEMGHVFLDDGHHGDGVMGTYIGSDGTCNNVVQGGLGNTERCWALNLYNPNITFNLKNTFGDNSGGGEMLVGSGSVSLSSEGYTALDRRSTQFPITLTTVTGQTMGGFPQQFVNWTGDREETNLSIQITGEGHYVANYTNLYAVTLAAAQSGDGGSITANYLVNSVNEGTSFSGHLIGADTLEAIPPSGFSFINWSDGSTQNPRFFTNNFSGYAIHKAYQASSYSDATGYNNQRKMVVQVNGSTTIHHMVYESGGDIWYSSSTNGGTWSNEVLVSDGSGNNHNPSIDVFTIDSYNASAQIVWVNTSNANVYFRERYYNSGSWSWRSIETVPTYEPTPGYNPLSWTPVVGKWHGCLQPLL